MRLTLSPKKAQATRMDAPDLDLDEVLLDAVDALVSAALERIGPCRSARFELFRSLLRAVQAAAPARGQPAGNQL